MELSIIGVFGAGLLTFFSPCVLPMVPIIAANYLLAGGDSRFSKAKSSILFSLGFLFTFTLMGLSLPMVSGWLGGAKSYLLMASAFIISIYGLKMSGLAFQSSENSRFFSWMSRSAFLPDFQKRIPKSLHGLLFGATFGLAWTPCVGPILGGVLTYVATKDRSLVESVILMLSFALGIVLPFIAFAVGGDLMQGQVHKLKKYLPKVEEFTGYALIAVGVMIFTQANPGAMFSVDKKDESSFSFMTSQGLTSMQQLAPGANKLLFFHSSHCPICQQMETYMPKLEKECNSNSFQIVRINVDLPENEVITNKFNIKAVPTMSLITAEGTELVHTVGYQSEINLRRAINLLPMKSCLSQVKSSQEEKLPDGTQDGKSCEKHDNGLTC